MKKTFKPRDKFKHNYRNMCADEEIWKHRQQSIWRCPDGIKDSDVVDGRFSRGCARTRAAIKKQNRRRSRRKWNDNLDMLDVRFDKTCVDMGYLID